MCSQKAAVASQSHAFADSPPCSMPVDKAVLLVLSRAAEIPLAGSRLLCPSSTHLGGDLGASLPARWVHHRACCLVGHEISIPDGIRGGWVTTQQRDTRHLYITVELNPDQGP